MQFVIPCETFVRLSKVALQPDEADHNRAGNLRHVRLEHKGGKLYATACNGKLLAGELVGNVTEADGFVHVANDPKLVEACQNEIAFNGNLIVTYVDGWAAANTTYGYFHPANVATDGWSDLTGVPKDWRTLVPKEAPTRANGTLVFVASDIARLGSSAPSGSFVFPRHIDKDFPVVVRDRNDPNWFGLFLVLGRGPDSTQPPPATIPDWVHSNDTVQNV